MKSQSLPGSMTRFSSGKMLCARDESGVEVGGAWWGKRAGMGMECGNKLGQYAES